MSCVQASSKSESKMLFWILEKLLGFPKYPSDKYVFTYKFYANDLLNYNWVAW